MTFVHFVCIALQWKPFDQVNILVRHLLLNRQIHSCGSPIPVDAYQLTDSPFILLFGEVFLRRRQHQLNAV